MTARAVNNTKNSPQSSRVLRRQIVSKPSVSSRRLRRYNKTSLSLMVMAVFIFGFGLTVSLLAWQTNHRAAAEVSALSKKAKPSGDDNGETPPSTIKPSQRAIDQYQVAADLPRYLLIPKFGIKSRVLQIGVTADGQLESPNNIYDAAWYSGSAKPGQGGATLLDGHVAGLKTAGVFHNLNKLQPGDQLQIVRGDNSVLTYRVVKSQTYASQAVNMRQALTPVTVNRPGLNLITCAGKVKSGTHQFDSRLLVFAEQL